MQNEMSTKDKIVDIEKLMEKEAEYRKAFAHGFNFANYTSKEKVMEWARSDLTKITGAPGSPYEGKLLADLDPKGIYKKDQEEFQKKWVKIKEEIETMKMIN